MHKIFSKESDGFVVIWSGTVRSIKSMTRILQGHADMKATGQAGEYLRAVVSHVS